MSITTKRTVCKELSREDFDLFFRIFSDREIMRYAWIDEFCCPDEAIPLFEDFLNGEGKTGYFFCAYSLENSRFIGFVDIQLHSINETGGVGEIGYFLLQDFWGKGYATELSEAMLSFGFSTLGLHKICARCNSNNLKSENIMIKLGMTKEGELRRVRYKKGVWDDEKHYGILKTEWSAKRNKV